MQNLNFLETELLDILFRGRNKNYGAYALRKNYASRVKQAMGITVLSVLLIYAVQFVLPKPDISVLTELPIFDPGGLTPLDDVTIISTGLPPAPAFDGPSKTIPTEVVDHTIVNVKPIRDDKEKLITSTPITQTGTSTTNNPSLTGAGGTGTSTLPTGTTGIPSGPATAAPPAKTVAPVITEYEVSEIMPEFPGGDEAMAAYLRNHINYPKIASEIGVEGIVYVQFVVSSKGKITKLKVLRGIGSGCDYEASRVIKSMPTWKPGIQDGQKVNVSFVLPVKFEL